MEVAVYNHATGTISIVEKEMESTPTPDYIPIDRRLEYLEDTNVDLVATSWDIDFRVCEIEWFLEDNIAPISINTFNLRGGNTMALSRYEQAKIIILGGVYDDATLRRQLKAYLDRDKIKQYEYDELIAMMDARLLVEGK